MEPDRVTSTVMTRIIVAGLFVLGLALGIWLLWPDGNAASGTATTIAASPATSTTVDNTVTTTIPAATTTLSIADSHVVETVEEAEEILRELWFGWFEGIYNQDEDRIREVVATEELFESAANQFGVMVFNDLPHEAEVMVEMTEILHADDDCLAVWSEVSAKFRDGRSDGVQILRWVGDHWLLLSVWTNKGDLWGADCESVLQSP